MNWTAWALAALLVLPGARGSVAVYVGKNLTEDGGALLAGYGDEPSSHWMVIAPRRQHPPGATITVGGTGAARMPGRLREIPQAAQTYRYLSMDYSAFAGFPAPITNGGMNEHGVAVRDVALNSRKELVEMTPKDQQGVNYSDVARIVLERARTAREAVEIAIDLVERYGDFTYGGNSHLFADAEEGWVFLTFAGGKGLWAARRLGPNEVWLNWRGNTDLGYIQELPAQLAGHPDYRVSRNFVSFATEQGWYNPAAGKPFHVIAVYCRARTSEQMGPEAREVEAAVRAAAPRVNVQVLMEQMHRTGKDSSGYAQVAHLRAGIPAALRTLWVAPGPGAAAMFVPWRMGVEAVPAEYRRHRYLTAGEAEKQMISPEDRAVEGTRYVNRAVKRLLYLLEEHREQFGPEVSAALRAWDGRQVAAQAGIERTARVLLAAGEEGLAGRYLTEQTHAAAGEGMRLLEALAASLEARTRVLFGEGGAGRQ
ncbi:MAG: C69 family dipeptidase [Acidobacteriaceae bacterium]|nr:C69 family dipeptidase [Acidobacteriaceae bacterium]